MSVQNKIELQYLRWDGTDATTEHISTWMKRLYAGTDFSVVAQPERTEPNMHRYACLEVKDGFGRMHRLFVGDYLVQSPESQYLTSLEGYIFEMVTGLKY